MSKPVQHVWRQRKRGTGPGQRFMEQCKRAQCGATRWTIGVATRRPVNGRYWDMRWLYSTGEVAGRLTLEWSEQEPRCAGGAVR